MRHDDDELDLEGDDGFGSEDDDLFVDDAGIPGVGGADALDDDDADWA